MKAAPYIDLHTHKRTDSEGVFELLNIVVGRDDFVLDLPFTAGIHPWYISHSNTQFASLYNYATHGMALAIGECGLDKICSEEWTKQERVFLMQLELANQLEKPIIVHCVRAYQEVLNLLKSTNQKIVFHGFNKHVNLAKQILEHGHYLSLGADILRGHMDEVIKSLPLDKIFLETDGKAVSIIDIYTYFCTARKISLSEFREQLSENFEQVFKYKL